MEKLTRAERETLINFCEADGEYIIETSIAAHIRKFDKLKYNCTREQLYDDGSVMCKEYRVPKRAVSFRKPEKPALSDEQKAKASANLKAIRETAK